jgi:signal transduction histidine kinase
VFAVVQSSITSWEGEIMLALSVIDWAVRAVSFFNMIALLWLGLTILLNAERRRWGTWIAVSGCVVSGLFFAGQLTVVGHVPGALDARMEVGWRATWLLFVIAPYLWYLFMAWYTGVLRAGRQRPWLAIVSALGIAALLLLVVAHSLPTYGELVQQSPDVSVALGGVPVVLLIYPVYSILCSGLALAALRRPEASERFMGDLAQRRARPWLVAASLVLLGVSLAVGGVAAWFLRAAELRQLALTSPQTLTLLMSCDLGVSLLIAAAVVLMGRAIVSYEIFTGKTLPRGGLFRHWRRSLTLAMGYGVLVGGSLTLPINPIYQLLLATILVTFFYALLSWRSYIERERGIERLRPFVTSQRLYEHLLMPPAIAFASGAGDAPSPAPPDCNGGLEAASASRGDGAAGCDAGLAGDGFLPRAASHGAAPVPTTLARMPRTTFQALCDDVLGARVAYLVALGPLAPLVSPPLVYPESAVPPLRVLTGIAARFHSPQTMCVALDPARYNGAVWAVPLWSERGLIGVLLLGDKRDGGLYTQEEIEIARAAGERLIDTQASAEMARRLMGLQRQRLAESQVLDQRTRRVLHDDVLPRLHAAMLTLSGAQAGATDAVPETVALLADIHHQIADLLHAMPATTAPNVARLGVIGTLRQAVDGELGSAFDQVTWQIAPEAEQRAQTIPAFSAEVIFGAAREAIRNAARYGRNGDARRPLHLTIAVTWRGGLQITIEDDGVGLGAADQPGQGSGQGLALHSTMMAVIGGTLAIESAPQAYTRIILTLPRELSFDRPTPAPDHGDVAGQEATLRDTRQQHVTPRG